MTDSSKEPSKGGFDLATEQGKDAFCDFAAKLIVDYGEKQQRGWPNVHRALSSGATFEEWYPIVLRSMLAEPSLNPLFELLDKFGIAHERFFRRNFEEFRKRATD